jgi:hypothetical protein
MFENAFASSMRCVGLISAFAFGRTLVSNVILASSGTVWRRAHIVERIHCDQGDAAMRILLPVRL